MKAISIKEHGNEEVLQYIECPKPLYNHNQVMVKIKACAINHLDIWVRNGIPGLNLPLPLILGSDASGIIVEVGKEVKTYKIGDEVLIQPGTFDRNCEKVKNGKENHSLTYGILGETENGVQSEYAALNTDNIFKKPSHLSFEEAASMPLTFMTSYQMIVEKAQLKKNESILIYGATSGIGTAGIQIAKDIGATVISTVGCETKKDFALSLGSDYVINHNKENLYKKVKSFFNYGVDVVFEHVGPLTWAESMKSLAIGGRIVTCGATTGREVSFDLRHLFMKQQSILGSTMGSIETFKNVMNKIESKTYYPKIDKIFEFKDIKNAHKRMEDRKQFGKIILVP